MTRHLGVSAFLSVVIVVFFAVALYQPEGPGALPSAPVSDRTTPESARVVEPRPAPTADVPPAAVSPERPAVQTRSVSRRSVPSERMRARPEINAPPQTARRPSSSPRFEPVQTRQTTRPPGRRPAFIHADAGETVTDVALRVYGSPDAARALWMANRDILPDRDARLSAGTVLRTP